MSQLPTETGNDPQEEKVNRKNKISIGLVSPVRRGEKREINGLTAGKHAEDLITLRALSSLIHVLGRGEGSGGGGGGR